MNLESRLTESLGDILRSSGYIFEIINKNKRQSNIVTGANNQLITPVVTAQLKNSISKFDDILDDTVSKFNDAKWCMEQMLQNRQKEQEIKIKEEEAKQRKRKEEEEKKNQERLREQEQREREQKRRADEQKKEKQMAAQEPKKDNGLDFGAEFDFNMMMDEGDKMMTNPADILGSLGPKSSDKQEEDLDINNILGNNDSILDGLNMSLLEPGNSGGNVEEEFDVDNFLNQFADND